MTTRASCLVATWAVALGCERTAPLNVTPAPEGSTKSTPSVTVSAAPALTSLTLEALIRSYDEPDVGEPKTSFEGKLVRVKGKVVERRVDIDAGWSTLELGLPGEEVTLACAFTPVEVPPMAVGAEVQVEGKLETRFKFSKKGGPAPDLYLGNCRVVVGGGD